MLKNNIILIGFMGVGKGTTARAFTKKYGTYIIDTDDLAEIYKSISKAWKSNKGRKITIK